MPRSSGPERGQFAKTQLCKFAAHNGCTRGAACHFAHSFHELRPSPDFTKTKMCLKFIELGRCENGECKYAHNKAELRKVHGMRADAFQFENFRSAPLGIHTDLFGEALHPITSSCPAFVLLGRGSPFGPELTQHAPTLALGASQKLPHALTSTVAIAAPSPEEEIIWQQFAQVVKPPSVFEHGKDLEYSPPSSSSRRTAETKTLEAVAESALELEEAPQQGPEGQADGLQPLAGIEFPDSDTEEDLCTRLTVLQKFTGPKYSDLAAEGRGYSRLLRERESGRIRFEHLLEEDFSQVANHYVARVQHFCNLTVTARCLEWIGYDHLEGEEAGPKRCVVAFDSAAEVALFQSAFEDAVACNSRLQCFQQLA